MIRVYERKNVSKRYRAFELIDVKTSAGRIPEKHEPLEEICTLPKGYETLVQEILNLSIRDDDIFVVTMPKCGTTWMQEAAWLILNDLNFEEAKRRALTSRSLFIE